MTTRRRRRVVGDYLYTTPLTLSHQDIMRPLNSPGMSPVRLDREDAVCLPGEHDIGIIDRKCISDIQYTFKVTLQPRPVTTVSLGASPLGSLPHHIIPPRAVWVPSTRDWAETGPEGGRAWRQCSRPWLGTRGPTNPCRPEMQEFSGGNPGRRMRSTLSLLCVSPRFTLEA